MRYEAPKNELQNYIGKALGHSDWLQITQDRINGFADVTNDHQFIHVDPERAKASPFGSTIAHGFLTLSLLADLCKDLMVVPENAVMTINYGFDKVRFIAPVKVDSYIRAASKVLDIQEKQNNQWLIKTEVTIEIQHEDKPALICEWLCMTVASE